LSTPSTRSPAVGRIPRPRHRFNCAAVTYLSILPLRVGCWSNNARWRSRGPHRWGGGPSGEHTASGFRCSPSPVCSSLNRRALQHSLRAPARRLQRVGVEGWAFRLPRIKRWRPSNAQHFFAESLRLCATLSSRLTPTWGSSQGAAPVMSIVRPYGRARNRWLPDPRSRGA